jgi:hypothetical protein
MGDEPRAPAKGSSSSLRGIDHSFHRVPSATFGGSCRLSTTLVLILMILIFYIRSQSRRIGIQQVSDAGNMHGMPFCHAGLELRLGSKRQ